MKDATRTALLVFKQVGYLPVNPETFNELKSLGLLGKGIYKNPSIEFEIKVDELLEKDKDHGKDAI